MITKLYVDNYRTMVNFSIEFNKLSILLGYNGAGKSSVFHVIQILRSILCDHIPVGEVIDTESLTRWQNIDVQTFELEAEDDEGKYSYKLAVQHNREARSVRIKSEQVLFEGHTIFQMEDSHTQLFNDSYGTGPMISLDWNYSGVGMIDDRKDNKLLTRFKKLISKIIVCAPKPFMMNDRCFFEKKIPDYDMKEFPALVRYYIQEKPECIQRWKEHLAENNPLLEQVFLSGNEEKILYFRMKNDDKSVYKASELSDGERQILLLHFLIDTFVSEGYSVFVDEPDNYIALSEMASLNMALEDASLQSGQCVVISHHSEMIDFFASANGIWFDRGGYGITRITEAPNPEDTFTYSEIMKMKG